MTLTRRPSPFSELATLRQAMDRLFDDTVFRPFTASTGNWDLARLPLDIRTTAVQVRPVTAGEAPAIQTDSAASPANADAPTA